ncbi:MAG TPA: Hpt domain-containing protein, partial [Aquabacterium sp.]|nr:Hpt domain-containing protein [Aquabacterium sp.]
RIAPGLPVVGLTAHAFETAKAHAREVGMVDYVTKPYMLDTLVDVILKHAKSKAGVSVPHPAQASLPNLPHESPNDPVEADWNAMHSHFGNNPALLQKLMLTLAETGHEILSNLRHAVDSRDFNKLRSEAHSLKGAALNLHTPALAKQAAEVQNLASVQAPVAFAAAKDLIQNLTRFLTQISASPVNR